MSRTKFVEGSPLTREALELASRWHEGQTRDVGGLPFVTHPVEVACLLHEAGYPDEVVAAGALHDVLEDTEVTRGELEERFGPRVAELVAAVSEDPSIEDRAERKAALRAQVAAAGEDAAGVFAADKISKTRELRKRARRGRLDRRDRAKLDHYEASLEVLSAALPGSELVERLRVELEQFEPEPAGR
jgi:(p)ppGpp synthase/HD superfamily hydrolase